MRAEAHLHIGRVRRGLEDCISMRFLPDGKTTYCGTLSLTYAKFSVQPAGLRKFRETGQKNVHAYVRGRFWGSYPTLDLGGITFDLLYALGYREAYYNPLTHESFVDKMSGRVLDSVYDVILYGKKVYYVHS